MKKTNLVNKFKSAVNASGYEFTDFWSDQFDLFEAGVRNADMHDFTLTCLSELFRSVDFRFQHDTNDVREWSFIPDYTVSTDKATGETSVWISQEVTENWTFCGFQRGMDSALSYIDERMTPKSEIIYA